MIFVEQQTVSDLDFGAITIRIVVSDSINEIVKTDLELGIDSNDYVDIIKVSTSSKDLNEEDGRYAIDELKFDIDKMSCSTENDFKCLDFCMDASNIDIARFIAVFVIDEAGASLPLIDNMEFSGKITESIRGKETVWMNIDGTAPREAYAESYSVHAELEFTAHSIDVSMLEQCKFNDNIYDQQGTKIDNVYDRWRSADWVDASALFETRTHGKSDNSPTVNNTYWRFAPLANLTLVLDKYLQYSKTISAEKYGINILFRLKRGGTLGYEVSPFGAEYTLRAGLLLDAYNIDKLVFAKDKKVKLRWSSEDAGDGWSSPFIHRDMLSPEYANDIIESLGSDYTNPARRTSTKLSFQSLDNTSELLYEIARANNLYIKTTQTIEGDVFCIEFELIPKGEIVDVEYTTIYDADSSTFESSSIILSGSNAYYAQGTMFTEDGSKDVEKSGYDSVEWVTADDYNNSKREDAGESNKLKTSKAERETLKENKSIDAKRLILSTSPTTAKWKNYVRYASDGKTYEEAHEAQLNLFGEPNEGREVVALWVNRPYNGIFSSSAFTEILHTGVYVCVKPFTQQFIARLGANYATWAQGSSVFAKIDGVGEEFDSLSDFINKVSSREVQFYKQERTLELPFFSGFQRNGVTGWKQAKLGAKVNIIQPHRRYQSATQTWITSNVSVEYAIVGVERNYNAITTTIKLQAVSRFAYGYWDGVVPTPSVIEVAGGQNAGYDTNYLAAKPFEYGEDIPKDAAIAIHEDGKAYKLRCVSEHREKQIGVSLESGLEGETKLVQFYGIVHLSQPVLEIGKKVYARSRASNGLISTTGLTLVGGEPEDVARYSEDMWVLLGKAVSDSAFILSPQVLVIDPRLLFNET